MVVFGRTWYGYLVTSFGGLWRPSHLSLTSHMMALRSHRGVPQPFGWSRLARWMLVMQCGMLMGNACANLEPCPRMPAAHRCRGLPGPSSPCRMSVGWRRWGEDGRARSGNPSQPCPLLVGTVKDRAYPRHPLPLECHPCFYFGVFLIFLRLQRARRFAGSQCP